MELEHGRVHEAFLDWIERAMDKAVEGHRAELLEGLRRFVAAARHVPGVHRIALVGSIVTAKPDPKDIDVLVGVSAEADLAPLAVHSRRLQGHAQSINRGADVFLANERGEYIGRTCRWKDCRPCEEVVAGLELNGA